MKSLFAAADDMYKTGLDMVRRMEGLQGTLPLTRDCIANLKRALMDYEHSRFSRREVTVTFQCPTPPREIEKRLLTKGRMRRPRQTPCAQGGTVKMPKPRIKNKDGTPIS